jgi:hypothetical protein
VRFLARRLCNYAGPCARRLLLGFTSLGRPVAWAGFLTARLPISSVSVLCRVDERVCKVVGTALAGMARPRSLCAPRFSALRRREMTTPKTLLTLIHSFVKLEVSTGVILSASLYFAIQASSPLCTSARFITTSPTFLASVCLCLIRFGNDRGIAPKELLHSTEPPPDQGWLSKVRVVPAYVSDRVCYNSPDQTS